MTSYFDLFVYYLSSLHPEYGLCVSRDLIHFFFFADYSCYVHVAHCRFSIKMCWMNRFCLNWGFPNTAHQGCFPLLPITIQGNMTGDSNRKRVAKSLRAVLTFLVPATQFWIHWPLSIRLKTKWTDLSTLCNESCHHVPWRVKSCARLTPGLPQLALSMHPCSCFPGDGFLRGFLTNYWWRLVNFPQTGFRKWLWGLSANAGDKCSIPGPRRLHMLWGN